MFFGAVCLINPVRLIETIEQNNSYKNPKIGLRLTKASKLSRSLTFLLFPDQPFHAAARNSGTSRIFFSEICAFYENCDSHSQNTLALCFLGSKKKFPSAGGTRSFSESPRELSIDFLWLMKFYSRYRMTWEIYCILQK